MTNVPPWDAGRLVWPRAVGEGASVADLLTCPCPFLFFVASVENSESFPRPQLRPVVLRLPYAWFTGNSFNPHSKMPMFLMFSTATASTFTNVSKGFTGQKSDPPMFIRVLTGLRLQTPKRVGVPILS